MSHFSFRALVLRATFVSFLCFPIAEAQQWYPSSWFAEGASPSVAMFNSTAIEVNAGGTPFFLGPMSYRVGQVSAQTVSWGSAYSYGTDSFSYAPSVAVTGQCPNFACTTPPPTIYVVEVNNYGLPFLPPQIYYTVGVVNGSVVNWGNTNYLDSGENPTVALAFCDTTPNIDCLYAVESHNDSSNNLWYHVGQVLGFDKISRSGVYIDWGPAYRAGSGTNPSVTMQTCVSNSGYYNCDGTNIVLVEAYSGQIKGVLSLFYQTGTWTNGTPNTISWGTPVNYGSGSNPKIALYPTGCQTGLQGDLFTEVHNEGATPGPLYYYDGGLQQSYTGAWSIQLLGAPPLPTQYSFGWNPSVAGANFNNGALEVHGQGGPDVFGLPTYPSPLWYTSVAYPGGLVGNCDGG
jgi:hypothetical protein